MDKEHTKVCGYVNYEGWTSICKECWDNKLKRAKEEGAKAEREQIFEDIKMFIEAGEVLGKTDRDIIIRLKSYMRNEELKFKPKRKYDSSYRKKAGRISQKEELKKQEILKK